MLVRLRKLTKLMEERGLSAFLISKEPNLRYFSGFEGQGILIVGKEGDASLLTSPLYRETAENTCEEGIEIIVGRVGEPAYKMVESFLSNRIKVALDCVNAGLFKRVSDNVGHDNVIMAEEDIMKMRMVKEDNEIEAIKKAGKITYECMNVVSDYIRPGIRELEIKALAVSEILRRGSDWPAFNIIVASGPRSSLPHGTEGDRKLEKGDVVVVDLGASYMGYKADMTRTFLVGDMNEVHVNKVMGIVNASKEEAQKLIRPGIKAKDVDMKARLLISKEGYGENFVHSLGHGIGLEVHELPTISPVSEFVIERNMVITCEPGVYIKQKFGVRIEDTLLVTDSQPLVLTAG